MLDNPTEDGYNLPLGFEGFTFKDQINLVTPTDDILIEKDGSISEINSKTLADLRDKAFEQEDVTVYNEELEFLDFSAKLGSGIDIQTAELLLSSKNVTPADQLKIQQLLIKGIRNQITAFKRRYPVEEHFPTRKAIDCVAKIIEANKNIVNLRKPIINTAPPPTK